MRVTTIFCALALTTSVLAAQQNQGNKFGNKFGQQGNKGAQAAQAAQAQNQNKGNQAAQSAAKNSAAAAAAAAKASAASAAAAASAATAAAASANNGKNNNNNNNNNAAAAANANGNNNANNVLLLNPNNVQNNSDSNGIDATAEAGQAPSDTDPANFINFCTGKTKTNGLQVKAGSCNGIVMGDMPASTSMISAMIVNPKPGDVLPANQDINFQVQIQNLVAGHFTNPDDTYYAAPQALQGGKVVGHTHFTVQEIGSLTTTTPPDPAVFSFFKGVNDAGNGNGLLNATAAGGLAAGVYRVCTMTSASNHQPVLMPVAQRGAQDDCTKFTVSDNAGSGNNNANGNANANANGNAQASAAAASASAAQASAAAASANKGNANKGNKGAAAANANKGAAAANANKGAAAANANKGAAAANANKGAAAAKGNKGAAKGKQARSFSARPFVA